MSAELLALSAVSPVLFEGELAGTATLPELSLTAGCTSIVDALVANHATRVTSILVWPRRAASTGPSGLPLGHPSHPLPTAHTAPLSKLSEMNTRTLHAGIADSERRQSAHELVGCTARLATNGVLAGFQVLLMQTPIQAQRR